MPASNRLLCPCVVGDGHIATLLVRGGLYDRLSKVPRFEGSAALQALKRLMNAAKVHHDDVNHCRPLFVTVCTPLCAGASLEPLARMVQTSPPPEVHAHRRPQSHEKPEALTGAPRVHLCA